jgi:hypothetical protein
MLACLCAASPCKYILGHSQVMISIPSKLVVDTIPPFFYEAIQEIYIIASQKMEVRVSYARLLLNSVQMRLCMYSFSCSV